ncbi:WG repeat-containing protein [Sphingobacterium sp. E70]|uniref:WG repeat-containing protein n=1 Tax=Sphingobacterium sp. E70 TaxID=2853439 RepID=UPI00211CD6CB|nr:WG repeat-containing protein [Sphingobacterium sp. E70]ULT27929.1 WG repeat-containing protein [Sphingobacterium sp. E70]
MVFKDNKYGYLDYSGKVVIPFKFQNAQPFENGLALVSEDLENFYYINAKGKFIKSMKSNPQTFYLSTLHRGKYMFILLTSILLIGIGMSKVPIQEIYKIIIALLMVPLALYLAIKCSTLDSTWRLDADTLTVSNSKKQLNSH